MKNERLTYKEPNGLTGLLGASIGEMNDTMYATVEKLCEYEETGLTPEQVAEIQDKLKHVHIGQVIAGYRIIGIFNGYCIAQSLEVSDNYVIWTIDVDSCGVHSGRYCSTREEAAKAFRETACTIQKRNKEHPRYQVYDLYECYGEVWCYDTLEEARAEADRWEEETGGECDLIIRQWDENLQAYTACEICE